MLVIEKLITAVAVGSQRVTNPMETHMFAQPHNHEFAINSFFIVFGVYVYINTNLLFEDFLWRTSQGIPDS